MLKRELAAKVGDQDGAMEVLVGMVDMMGAVIGAVVATAAEVEMVDVEGMDNSEY